MPAGRPNSKRPLSGRADAQRERMRAALVVLADPPKGLPAPIVATLREVVEHFLELDEQELADLAVMRAHVEADTTVSELHKAGVIWLINAFGRADASGRQQMRTLIGNAVFGKPPEAASGAARRGLRHVPGGGSVTAPTFSKADLAALS